MKIRFSLLFLLCLVIFSCKKKAETASKDTLKPPTPTVMDITVAEKTIIKSEEDTRWRNIYTKVKVVFGL